MKAGKLSDFTPDPRNANKGTDRGRRLLRQSIRKLKAGRSLLVDKRGVLIAGNKTREAAIAEGLTEVIIVPTDGTKLVVVQRTDLDLETDPEAKELAIADNRINEIGLEWESEVLVELNEATDLSQLFLEAEMEEHFNALDDSTEAEQADPKGAERRVQKKASSVKAVMLAEDIATFENALRETKEANRGKALIKVCQFYLDHGG